jgi:FkbM family methyltransferase
MTTIDVGANIGVYTLFLRKLVGPTGRVIAIEAEPKNYSRLLHAVNKQKNIETIHAAAAERFGKLRLFMSEKLNVDHHTYDEGEGRQCIEIDAVALDDLVQRGEPVHFIKMDIQGAELSALKGAERILRENYSIKILLEYWPYGLRRSGHEPKELLSLLADSGFQIKPVGVNKTQMDRLGNNKDEYCNLIAERA